jgi:DNA-binding response OmpR family regulator
MALDPRRVRSAEPLPCILVVDDDRRVLELLEIALSAHGFRVITAADGDEGIQRAVAERPDLIVLDVRLPRRSGFEVCEWLRRDPDEPHVPIILVSAAGEAEARLQAFRRGADDYLSKPFSPKELVARARRLLERAGEARESRERARDLERELGRSRDEARRAHAETKRALRIRELAFGVGRELHRTLDVDELARRLLAATTSRLGVGMAALFLSEHAGGPLVALAVRGEGLERVNGIEIATSGPLGSFLAGLGRPVLRRDLERFAELRDELPPFVALGAAILAPLRGANGLQGLLVVDERRDGREPDPDEVEMLDALCAIAETAVLNAVRVHAQLDRGLELLAETTTTAATRERRVETASLVERAARATLMPSRLRSLLAHAVRLAGHDTTPDLLRSLATLTTDDPTGRIAGIERLLALAAAPADAAALTAIAPEERRAAVLFGIARATLQARERGLPLAEAVAAAIEAGGQRLDGSTRQALDSAVREMRQLAPDPA